MPRPPPRAGDLSQFGKFTKDAPMVMGPNSVFAGKKDNKRDSLSRTNSSSDRFFILSGLLSQYLRLPEPSGQRRKQQLLPRMRPATAEETALPASEEEPEAPVQMSEAGAKKEIDEDFYFANLMEELPSAASKGQCSPQMFEAGFLPMAELLDETAIDAPNAFKFMAVMPKGAGFDKESKTRKDWAGLLADRWTATTYKLRQLGVVMTNTLLALISPHISLPDTHRIF
ncbi:hypothetical protein BU15DRAFT_75689 [Melanogaster broomeanus]|nr:hypothetical protein BU15DRAFT_75689 [Melanogaster broomeanus]